jgi:hypothetical protein
MLYICVRAFDVIGILEKKIWTKQGVSHSFLPIPGGTHSRRGAQSFVHRAVFSCEKDAKSVCEKHCITFRLYVVNIVLP